MVYLIHFARPISDKHSCQHYIGYTSLSGKKRLAVHKSGRGARLTQVANERGIDYKIVRMWRKSGTRSLERKLKNYKNAKFLCPICSRKVKK